MSWAQFNCCNVQPAIKSNSLSARFEPCLEHSESIKFICKDSECIGKNQLLCPICLPSHREHEWVTIESYFPPYAVEPLLNGVSRLNQLIKEATNIITDNVKIDLEKVNYSITDLQTVVDKEMHRLKDRYEYKEGKSLIPDNINQSNFESLAYIIAREKNQIWIGQMIKGIGETLRYAVNQILDIITKIKNIYSHYNWEHESSLLMDNYCDTSNLHDSKDTRFLFSQVTTNKAIQVSSNKLTVKNTKQKPKKPAAVLQGSFKDPTQMSILFHVVKLPKSFMIFSSSNVLVGLANQTRVENDGLCRLNQAARGAYCIGSNGWCYHNNLAKYDRKDILGWTFSEGDYIKVELILGEPCKIKFTKNPTSYFYKTFEMELELNREKCMQLKPCLMFDGDPGSEVAIISNEADAVSEIVSQRSLIDHSRNPET